MGTSRAWDRSGRAKRPVRLALLWLLAALSPLWLGPLLTPIRLAAAATTHLCACGMAEGTCGCPECEALELAHAMAGISEAAPALKGECGGGAKFLGDAHVPPGVLPSPRLVAPATFVALVAPTVPVGLTSLASDPPPIPPPRRA